MREVSAKEDRGIKELFEEIPRRLLGGPSDKEIEEKAKKKKAEEEAAAQMPKKSAKIVKNKPAGE